MKNVFPHGEKGFTLAEILLVVALILIIAIIILTSFKGQIDKGHDIQRKTDLERIQKAFEEYYNDNHQYPVNSPLGNCGGTGLAPYLSKVPCDPTSKMPYKFIPGVPSPADGYIVCARLQDLSDPVIKAAGCDPIQGCGWGVGYNYCVSAGQVPSGNLSGNGNGGGNGSGGGGNGSGGGNGGNQTPTPTPTPATGIWACTPDGNCNAYADTSCDGGGACCPHTYQAFGCVVDGVYQCANQANRCTRY